MATDITAREIIQRVRQGDAVARDHLFRRYQGYLEILARAQLGRHLRGKCDSADIVQMTLLEAHRDFASFRGEEEAELLAWLRRILAHNLYNEARRFAAQQREIAREVSLDQVQAGVEQSSLFLGRLLPANSPTPSQLASRREIEWQLADAIAQLPEDYQAVLLLRIFEELPAEEVALRMGRSAGAVRMLQMRALSALREILEVSSPLAD
ncbi:MAG: sigma-70 family RNA polymerase sigma factor [Gemmataceae bacterium]